MSARRGWPRLAGALLAACLAAHAGAGEGAVHKNRAERRAQIERLVPLLKSEVWAEREEAHQALLVFGAEALPLLTALDADKDPELAWRLKSLIRGARLGTSGELREKVGELMQTYATQTPQERIQTLGKLSGKAGAAAGPLFLGLLDAEEDLGVLRAILGYLGTLGAGPDGLPTLLKLYAGGPQALRPQVLWALSAIPGVESRKLAREALGADGELQTWAIRAVLRMADRQALPDLRRLARGGEQIATELQIQALNALTSLVDDGAAEIFHHALEGPAEVQTAALAGIGGLHDRSAAPILLAWYGDEAKKDLREELLATMGSVNDPAFLPILRKALKSDNNALRIQAVQALTHMDAREAGPEIAALLDDPDPDVMQLAIGASAALGAKEAAPRLQRLLAHSDKRVGLLAAQALACLEDPAGLKALLSMAAKSQPPHQHEAIRLLGEWQIEAGLPLLRGLAAGTDETADFANRALFDLVCDADAFRELLRPALLAHLRAPRSADGAKKLAQLLEDRGLMDHAVKPLEALVRRQPADMEVLGRLANYYQDSGRYAECEAAFDRLAALGGTNYNYLNNRAWFYCTAYKQEFLKPQEALTMARRAVAMSPRSTYIVDTLGWALHMAGQYEEGIRELRRAQLLIEAADKPRVAWERTRVARSLFAAGRKDEALAEVATALAEAPRAPKVWFEAAGFYAGAGRRDEAVNALHVAIDRGYIRLEVLELNPEFDALRKDPGYTTALLRCRKARAAADRLVEEVEAEVLKTLAAEGPPETPADEDEAVQIFPDE